MKDNQFLFSWIIHALWK